MSASGSLLPIPLPLRVIHWGEAMFCQNCHAVSSAPVRSCPVCVSEVLLPLQDVVPQLSWESEQGVPVLGIGEGR